MSMSFNRNGIGPTAPIQPLSRASQSTAANLRMQEQGVDFTQVLQREMKRSDSLQFSNHATQRMKDRGLTMTPELMNKMNDAVNQAAAKGSKQSLLLVQNAAYIVNVPSRTIITAMDEPFNQGHVFTAIDSAVCIN